MVNQTHQLVILSHNFITLQTSKALKAHIENGAGLDLAQGKAFDKLTTSYFRVARATNQLNNLVQMVEGNEQPFENMSPFLSLG